MELIATSPGRRFYLASAATITSLPEALGDGGDSFVLFVAADSAEFTEDAISPVVVEMVKQGLVYVCAWGPGCSGFETSVDLAIVKSSLEAPGEDVIMTTAHEDESLEAALWFFAHCAFPANDCERWIAVSIGNKTWAEAIRRLIPEILKPKPDAES